MRPDHDLIRISPAHMALQVRRLASLLGGLQSWAATQGLIWKAPLIAVDYDGTLMLEWWAGKDRTLGIYLDGDRIWYYGLHDQSEGICSDDEIPRSNTELTAALAWLYGVDQKG